MKKTIALVMALVMTAALLVGCGGQGNAGNSKFETSDTYTLKMHLSVAATDPSMLPPRSSWSWSRPRLMERSRLSCTPALLWASRPTAWRA